MTTVVNNPGGGGGSGDSGGGMGFFFGMVLLVVVVVLFLVYGLPYLRSATSQPTVNIPDKVNINVQNPNPPSSTGGGK